MIVFFSSETLNINYHINIVIPNCRKFHFLKNRVNLLLVLLTTHITLSVLIGYYLFLGKTRDPNISNSITAHESDKMDWYFIAALLLVSVIGIVGNIFAIFVVVQEKLYKQRIWSYLLSLSFSDIYSFCITLPVTAAAFYDENLLQRRSICILQGSSMNFLMGWSLITIGFVNSWKYICIKSSLIDRVRGTSWLIIFIGVTLPISGSLAIAPILGFSQYIHQRGRKWCVVQTNNKYRPLLFVLVAAFVILCIIVVFCNVATYRLVSREVRTYSQKYHVSETMEHLFNRRRYKVFQTTLIVTLMFFVCWAPLFTMILIEGFGGDLPLLYSKISYVCALAQGFVNPIIYSFGHNTFKKRFQKLLTCCKRKGNRVRDTERSNTDDQETRSTNL